jgi:hypothetical protein
MLIFLLPRSAALVYDFEAVRIKLKLLHIAPCFHRLRICTYSHRGNFKVNLHIENNQKKERKIS